MGVVFRMYVNNIFFKVCPQKQVLHNESLMSAFGPAPCNHETTIPSILSSLLSAC